jgi:chitodextrinase
MLTLAACLAVDSSAFCQSLDAIRILGISRSDTNVHISWQGGFPPYRLQVNKGHNPKWEELPDLITNNAFTAASAEPASFYQVRTEFEPLRLTRIGGDGAIVYLDWRGGRPPYKVQVCDSVDSGWVELPRVILDNFYAGFASGHAGFYRIRTEPDTNAPSLPQGLSLEAVQCDRVVLSWQSGMDASPGSGLLGHNLYRDGQLVKQVRSPHTFVLDTGLTWDHSYAYSISAVDGAGNESARSTGLTIKTPQCSGSGTNGTGSGAGVTLAWDPSEEPNIAGYIVHWGNEPGVSTWQIDVMQATTANISDLESGEPYFFSVTAYNLDGVESEPSYKVAYIPP